MLELGGSEGFRSRDDGFNVIRRDFYICSGAEGVVGNILSEDGLDEDLLAVC